MAFFNSLFLLFIVVLHVDMLAAKENNKPLCPAEWNHRKDAPTPCPEGGWVKFGVHCYLAFNKPYKNITSCEEECLRVGAFPTTMITKEENDFVLGLSGSAEQAYWTGMRIEWADNTTIKNAYWRELQKGPHGVVECKVPMPYGNPLNTKAGTPPWAASITFAPEPNNIGSPMACMFIFSKFEATEWKHSGWVDNNCTYIQYPIDPSCLCKTGTTS